MQEKSNQFIKITESDRERKLNRSAIFRIQLQEIIAEIHTKMEDYEFPISTLRGHFQKNTIQQRELKKFGKNTYISQRSLFST